MKELSVDSVLVLSCMWCDDWREPHILSTSYYTARPKSSV